MCGLWTGLDMVHLRSPSSFGMFWDYNILDLSRKIGPFQPKLDDCSFFLWPFIAIWPHAKMPKWGIPEKSIENVAQTR